MQPIVIVGSGMASYTLIREFRKLDNKSPLIVICSDDATYYAKPTLSNALTLNKSPEQISLGDSQKMAAQFNLQINTFTTVKKILPDLHQITLEKQGKTSVLDYSKLILAVGASPIDVDITGNDVQDIYTINSLHDYRNFYSHLKQIKNNHIVILGAGLIGCEFANDLNNSGYKVTVIDLSSQPLAHLISKDFAHVFCQNLEKAGIQFIFSTTIRDVNKTDNSEYQYNVVLSNGQTLMADTIISAVGLKPDISLAEQSNIDINLGISTNQFLETNHADIFAIGDCAEINGLYLPYVMPIMQQARALAKTLNGERTSVHYPAMPISIKTPSSPLTVLPVPTNLKVEWIIENTEDGLIAKAVDNGETLRGFVLIGSIAMKQRFSLTKLVPDLLPIET